MAQLPSTIPPYYFLRKEQGATQIWGKMRKLRPKENATNKVQCLWSCFCFQSQIESEFQEKPLKEIKESAKTGLYYFS